MGDYPGYPVGPITSGHMRGKQRGRQADATLLTPWLEKGVTNSGRQEVSKTMNGKKMCLPWDLQKESSTVGPFQTSDLQNQPRINLCCFKH